MSRRRNRRRRGGSRYGETEDLNPMNFVSNLSDVMLILAVGIMLALILHWNVRIENGTGESETEAQAQEEAVTFSADDLEQMEELPEDMEKTGSIYYDSASGKYYIIEDQGE